MLSTRRQRFEALERGKSLCRQEWRTQIALYGVYEW